MDFLEIARQRQSCRAYDEGREVEEEKLHAILEAARIAPSACNGQPYKLTVCRGKAAEEVALACRGHPAFVNKGKTNCERPCIFLWVRYNISTLIA